MVGLIGQPGYLPFRSESVAAKLGELERQAFDRAQTSLLAAFSLPFRLFLGFYSGIFLMVKFNFQEGVRSQPSRLFGI